MISQSNLSVEIGRMIPGLSQPLHALDCESNVYRQIALLTQFVADSALADRPRSTSRALQLLDRLHANGNPIVRGAIENVFVFSLSATLARLGAHRERLLGLLPLRLFTIYMNQVQQRGC